MLELGLLTLRPLHILPLSEACHDEGKLPIWHMPEHPAAGLKRHACMHGHAHAHAHAFRHAHAAA